MDLREFVKETLLQVCSGVKDAQDAQDAVGETGAIVSPDTGHLVKHQQHHIEFDVAVTVLDEGQKSVSAGLRQPFARGARRAD